MGRLRKRIRRLAPKDVPPDFYRLFGYRDPSLCRRVAIYVDRERRMIRADMALIEIGSREGFGRSKGFELLKAGRYLLNQETEVLVWRKRKAK